MLNNNKITAVIGASPNADRYSYKATISLKKHGYTVFPVGIKKGKIEDLEIITEKEELQNVDTVTLYVSPANQRHWYDYIISLQPKRIIFNPGTENPEFEKLASENGIECQQACTLVLLAINEY